MDITILHLITDPPLRYSEKFAFVTLNLRFDCSSIGQCGLRSQYNHGRAIYCTKRNKQKTNDLRPTSSVRHFHGPHCYVTEVSHKNKCLT